MDETKLLQSHLPVDVACETDGDNGRWRLTHRVPGPRQQKSISWTMAGAGPAAAAALKEAFRWHESQTGKKMPEATAKLVKKWQGLPPPERKPEDRWQGPAAEPARSSTELLAVKPATLGGLLFWRCSKYMSIGLLIVLLLRVRHPMFSDARRPPRQRRS